MGKGHEVGFAECLVCAFAEHEILIILARLRNANH